MSYIPPLTITGPALHGTQVRAYALMAAATGITLAPAQSLRGASYENVEEWEARVLRSAARFERYISSKIKNLGSEDPAS